MTLYFAYGSNMSRAMMRRRCPGAAARGTGRLDGWGFIIMPSGYASIVPDAGAVVHGVLWRVTPRNLAALNAYEALDAGLYRRRLLPVRTAAGRLVRALTYVGCSGGRGRPRAGYQDGIVVPSAQDWKLPAAYVAELQRWSPAARRLPPPAAESLPA